MTPRNSVIITKTRHLKLKYWIELIQAVEKYTHLKFQNVYLSEDVEAEPDFEYVPESPSPSILKLEGAGGKAGQVWPLTQFLICRSFGIHFFASLMRWFCNMYRERHRQVLLSSFSQKPRKQLKDVIDHIWGCTQAVLLSQSMLLLEESLSSNAIVGQFEQVWTPTPLFSLNSFFR